MKQITDYQISFLSNDIKEQVKVFLTTYQQIDTIAHSYEVAEEAKELANRFNLSPEKAFVAGLLHDISAVIPNNERVPLQQSMKEEVLKEEAQLPMILHQKQSVFIAREIFDVQDVEVLSAIECHTTLKKQASDFDKVVFLADKVKWDRKSTPPYLEQLEKALEVSLDEGCRVYIDWLLSDLIVLHPWLAEAMEDLKMKVPLVSSR